MGRTGKAEKIEITSEFNRAFFDSGESRRRLVCEAAYNDAEKSFSSTGI